MVGLIKKGLRNPRSIIPYILRIKDKYIKYRSYGRVRRENIIWHVCTPKCASTYFLYYIKKMGEENSRINSISPRPFGENRPQVVCVYTLLQKISRIKMYSPIYYVERFHALPTNDLFSLMSDNHTVIVQTRSIFDTIISIFDHMNRSPVKPWAVNANIYWGELSDEQKYDDIITNYLPWHIAFLQGWLKYIENHNNCYLVTFDDFLGDKKEVIKTVFKKYEIIVPDKEFDFSEREQNFNKGVKGRGKLLLTKQQQDEIETIVKRMDYLNQGLLRFL